jgi:hypothetical protein
MKGKTGLSLLANAAEAILISVFKRLIGRQLPIYCLSKDLCEGNLTFKECAESLKFMINGKHPGSDGYTVDFYKFFWKDIGH